MGRLIGVPCAICGVALGMRGVPAGWLCWLPRADILGAMGAPIAPWFWTTEGGRAGLPAPMPELVCCIGTCPTMGDDMFCCGVFCRATGEEADA